MVELAKLNANTELTKEQAREKRDKELIAKIVIKIKSEYNLSDCQIAKILSIGKNRINQLKREGFIKEH